MRLIEAAIAACVLTLSIMPQPWFVNASIGAVFALSWPRRSIASRLAAWMP